MKVILQTISHQLRVGLFTTSLLLRKRNKLSPRGQWTFVIVVVTAVTILFGAGCSKMEMAVTVSHRVSKTADERSHKNGDP
jgi:hypothetical protein